MNKYFNIVLIFCLSFSVMNCANAQKRKKRNKKDNTYTENLDHQIPVYQMPTFNLDSLADTTTVEVLEVDIMPDNVKGADSLCNVVKKYNKNKTKISGYRIQFWTGTNAGMMNQAVNLYRQNYADFNLSIHTEYPDGTFRVKAGDWVKADHLIAHRHLLKIKEEFPQALLVPDMVNLNKI